MEFLLSCAEGIPKLEHLIVVQNPVSDISPLLFRQYALNLIFNSPLKLPMLSSFNDVPITPEERNYSMNGTFNGFLPAYLISGKGAPLTRKDSTKAPAFNSLPSPSMRASTSLAARRNSVLGKPAPAGPVKPAPSLPAGQPESELSSPLSVQLSQSARAACAKKTCRNGQFTEVFDSVVHDIISETLYYLQEFYE